MKQKKMKYVLIAGVLLIWTLVVVRVIRGMGRDKHISLTMSTVKPMPVLTDEDSFTLYANYQDPFLREKIESTEDIDSVHIAPVLKEEPQKVHLPIVYHGLITNSVTKNKIALVSIRNTDYSLHEDEKSGDITIKKISKEYIDIVSNGNRERIPVERRQ